MKYLYKYPQAEFPYERLVQEGRRPRNEAELELLDSGVFDEDRYFDVFVEYAKDNPESFCIRISVVNRGPETARLDLLPTLWFRNTWSWSPGSEKPRLWKQSEREVRCEQSYLGVRRLYVEGSPELLFAENETNFERLYNAANGVPYVKDGIGDYIVHGRHGAVNPGADEGRRWRRATALIVGPGRQRSCGSASPMGIAALTNSNRSSRRGSPRPR